MASTPAPARSTFAGLSKLSDIEIPKTMTAVLLTGHGGFERLEYRTDISTPSPARGEVLIQVAAAGINNTDINTRIGWYGDDSGWAGAGVDFPQIQGADCCGRIVAVGRDVNSNRLGERVLVRAMQGLSKPSLPLSFATLGADMDGAFAQYVAVNASHALTINSDWSDVDLASLPCAYSTAEAMLTRANVREAMRVLITGASGGVGSAAVQLAKLRGAEVIAVASEAKANAIRELGADEVIDRDAPVEELISNNSIDVIVDVVGGKQWHAFCDLLKHGGCYVTSGAIAGPIVELDLRKLYLKDLNLVGSPHQSDAIFEHLIDIVEANSIRPVVAKTFALKDIVPAQELFLMKQHVGKLVLIPPQD